MRKRGGEALLSIYYDILVALLLLLQYPSRSLDQSQPVGQDPGAERGATAANWSHRMASASRCLSLSLFWPSHSLALGVAISLGCCESHGDWPVLGGYREGLGQ